ncbi:MAG: selenocysteine-specific translation elongation factor [Phycisphaerales bacterium]|nr:selenocysteine-specific translation elongation factor [Phycisphaerales bacterium]
MSLRPQLVVGTAGHIDHGKSSLVRALTGTDPDRLPEEKARGMTIDLGFAHLPIDDVDVHFVDVPGHERFLRHMVAGATGIDLALLVVAADESVMPQTREHAEVLSLLGVKNCAVVLTKVDLVDNEMAEIVADEAASLLASFDIRALGLLRSSAATGHGLEELKAFLRDFAKRADRAAQRAAWFRLPIDRAFTVAGRGTVVTGSVMHGATARDEELQLWPAGQVVRVRELQAHHAALGSADGRMRLAVNLAGVELSEVGRGCELATRDYLSASTRLLAALSTLRLLGRAGRKRIRARLHIATSEVLAEIILPASEPAAEPENAANERVRRNIFVELRTAAPIVAEWGQRFLLRDESGLRTLGGGRVIHPALPDRTKLGGVFGPCCTALAGEDPAGRVAATLHLAGWTGCDVTRLAALTGLADAPAAKSLIDSLLRTRQLRAITTAGQPIILSGIVIDELAKAVRERLENFLKANPLSPGVPRSEWPGWMPRSCPAALRPWIAEHMIGSGAVHASATHVGRAERKAALSADDQALFDSMLAEFAVGAFQPPAPESLRCRTPKNERRIRQLIDLAVAQKRLVRVEAGLYLHADCWAEAARLVAQRIVASGPITVAEIRTLLNSTRKFVVPIVEHLDATGVTKRSGDTRSLGPNAPSD